MTMMNEWDAFGQGQEEGRREYPPELLEEMKEEIRNTFDGAVSEFREAAYGNAGGLGLNSYNLDLALGEGGLAPGSIDEVLRLISERVTALSNNLYGGQFGYGYATNNQEVGDTIRQLSALMWIFPEYNPLLKNMVRIRATYVFGEGVEVLGESRKRVQKYIRELREKRELEKEALRQQQEAMLQMGMAGSNGAGGSGQSAGGGQPQGQARNALYQKTGTTGHAPSVPGGRREELAEAWSGAGGGRIGHRFPVGGIYGMIGTNEEPSEIAEAVREFFEDPCNRERFCSVDSLQRLDIQVFVEGNAFIALRNKGPKRSPQANVLPTSAVQSVIVDDLPDGMGNPLGYVITPLSLYGNAGDNGLRWVYPAMMANDVPRLKQVMEHRRMQNYQIDDKVRMYHVKEWGPNWRVYGLPGILSSLTMATGYMSFTREWIQIQRVLRTYMMVITGNGNNKGLNQIHSNYISRIADMFSGNADGPGSVVGATGNQRIPSFGMALMAGQNSAGMPGTRVEPVRTSGSTDPPAMAREIKMMALMGAGYPDNMYSDTSVGTMSRADVLERQTHLIFRSSQERYSDMFKAIAKCVVEMRLGEEQRQDTDIQVNWPALVKPSNLEQASALIQLYQNDGIMRKVFVEECYKLLNRSDRHEMMQIGFMGDEDGFEFKSDQDLDTLSAARTGQGGLPGESADVNDPLGGMEDDGWYPELDRALYG